MSYPSDLRDKDWDLIKPHFATRKYGNQAIHSRHSLVDGILYEVKNGVKANNAALMGKKKVKGCKRQIVVDMMGNLHQVLVHRANTHRF